MKLNKFTTALVGLGIVSAASVAQANSLVFLTGSTAARAFIYNAFTANKVFTGGCTVYPTSASNATGTLCYEGSVSGVTGLVDVDCDFTGSEAGIADVAKTTLTQSVNGDPTGALPGTGANVSYLTPGSGFTTTDNIADITSSFATPKTYPDLTMADTSQAVSQTPNSGTTKLVTFKTVAIVPFTFMKGYEATPDQTWNNITNVTTASINQNLNGPLSASIHTGIASDTEPVVVCGRNLGSGTRANAMLSGSQFGISGIVDQWAYDSDYPSATPDTLTFGDTTAGNTDGGVNYASPQSPSDVGNDGFDGGSGVQKSLNVDGTGATISFNGGTARVHMIGYVGLSDAKNAAADSGTGAGSGDAVYITYNGQFESDANVEEGAYQFWGLEHLYGRNGLTTSTTEYRTGSKIASGITSYLASGGYGNATGNLSTTQQSVLIPWQSMQVNRTDSGFAKQGSFSTDPN